MSVARRRGQYHHWNRTRPRKLKLTPEEAERMNANLNAWVTPMLQRIDEPLGEIVSVKPMREATEGDFFFDIDAPTAIITEGE